MTKEKETKKGYSHFINVIAPQLIFPQYCISCGKFGNYLCKNCLFKFPQNLPECYVCRTISQNNIIHKKCKINLPSQIIASISLYQYTNSARKLMKKLKYESAYIFKYVINKLINKKLKIIKTLIPHIDSLRKENIKLIPIPLHKKRLIKRGYNQAMLIAKILEKYNIGTIQTNILFKTTNTVSQVSKNKNLRQNSINPFKCVKQDLINKKVIFLIVDDVMTTGTTISMATKALSKVYLNKIYAFTMFRPVYRGALNHIK